MKKLLFSIFIISLSMLACTMQRVETPNPQKIVTPTASQTETCTPSPTVTPKMVFVRVDVGLNLRRDSSESSELILTIPPNENVKILGELLENGWICVEYNGNAGFVNADFLNLK